MRPVEARRKLLTIRAACAAALSVFAFTGCGESPSNDEQIMGVVRTFLGALGEDGGKACSQLTEDAQTSLVTFAEATPCEKAALSIKSAPPALAYFEDNFEGIRYRGTEDQITEVDIRPAVSFAPLEPIPLVRTDDGWKITEVGWYFR